MKPKSKATTSTGSSLMVPDIATMASFSPVFFCAAVMRSRYFLESRNFSGSFGDRPASCSWLLPSSRSDCRRLRAEIA